MAAVTQFWSEWSNFLGQFLDIIDPKHTKRAKWSEILLVFWYTLMVMHLGCFFSAPIFARFTYMFCPPKTFDFCSIWWCNEFSSLQLNISLPCGLTLSEIWQSLSECDFAFWFVAKTFSFMVNSSHFRNKKRWCILIILGIIGRRVAYILILTTIRSLYLCFSHHKM